jgi:phage-related protein
MIEQEHDKPLFWIASSKNDLKDCPDEVQNNIGYALHCTAWIAETQGKTP